ncbi:hypothetical protein GALMADRAFT_147558 [Galerina marginata CBS 339.88]|uniref:Serine aminopeptidase S33 domain-containing protein n=1 Tax=Galerina marginata (strain CBS 339.88) TaxID=685588 RepID=A0A067S7U9_GALM3|nr:hypothetical protein GALMADRAFT_147558 [Galerina marginata CBS 339.88]
MEAPQPEPPTTAAYEEEWVIGPHNTNFYTRTYSCVDPIAAVAFVHGAAEHSERFSEMHTNFSTKHNIAVFSFDLRGFGRTALDKDHRSKDAAYGKSKWEFQMDDVEWAIEQTAEKFPAVPIFLMGVSMGGGQALGLLCDKARAENTPVKRITGVIAGSPCITLANPVPKAAVWIVNILSSMKPYMVFPIKNNANDLSRNPETNASYLSDPFITQSPGSLQSLKDMIGGGEALLNTGYAYWPEKVPVLFLHGTGDKFTSPKGTEALFEKFPANDKKLILYPGAYHELHNEPDGVKEKSLSDVVAFILAHCPPFRAPSPQLEGRGPDIQGFRVGVNAPAPVSTSPSHGTPPLPPRHSKGHPDGGMWKAHRVGVAGTMDTVDHPHLLNVGSVVTVP